MRLNDEEHARLDALAKHHGLAAAGLLRMLLRKEEREVFPVADENPVVRRVKPHS